MSTLTRQQQKALHLWFRKKSDQCRDAGVSPRMAFERTIELEMTPELMKEIWRTVQKSLYGTGSTTQLEKVEQIDEIAETLNRFFAQEFHLDGIAIPSHELGYWESAPLRS